MIVKVCVGSACYVKGSHIIVKSLEELINKNNLEDKITLKASFCLGHCTNAVAVELDEKEIFSLEPEGVTEFFNLHIKKRVL